VEPAEPVQAIPPEPEVTPIPEPVAEDPVAADADADADEDEEEEGTPLALAPEPLVPVERAIDELTGPRRWPIPVAAVLLALNVALLGGVLLGRRDERA
jgi:hypothetical protein